MDARIGDTMTITITDLNGNNPKPWTGEIIAIGWNGNIKLRGGSFNAFHYLYNPTTGSVERTR